MFCPKCGKINPDSEEVCSGCGAVLHEASENSLPTKSNKNKAIITAIVILIVIIAVVLFLNACDPGNMANDNMTF